MIADLLVSYLEGFTAFWHAMSHAVPWRFIIIALIIWMIMDRRRGWRRRRCRCRCHCTCGGCCRHGRRHHDRPHREHQADDHED